MKKLLLAGLATLSLTAPAAFAQQGYYPCWGDECGMMGPGMMGGWGMGPGMMGGYGYAGPRTGIGLNKEQAEKIVKIRADLAKEETPLMQQIAEERRKLSDMYYSGADPSALDQAYRKTSDLERQVFSARAGAQKQMDAVLTKEQRERMQRRGRGHDRGYGPGMWPGYGHDMCDWD